MIKVSIVLPTYNRVERLKSVLQALENQSYPLEKFEVLVVSDGSTDGTDNYLANLASPLNLLPINQANQGPAAARNTGVTQASGEFVLFIDDDVVPIPNFIDEHMNFHQGNSTQIVIGPMITPDNYIMSPWVNYEQTMLMKQYQAMVNGEWSPTARQFYTGNASLMRKHIIEAGGFDPAFRRAEDLELAYRLNDKGLQFVFNPQAVGFHFAERSFESWSRIAYTYGRNDVIFTTKKGQQWLLPQVFREFATRHLFIQILTWILLDRTQLSEPLIAKLKSNVESAYGRNNNRLAIMLCSSIYNLKYYQGVSDEFGGRKVFFRALRQVVKSN
ncbi:MAG: glycosyltransferase [Ardenticatenaceae bacterium]|nr:glycosyltransferase [Ardenticatenaceae bacterium]